MSLTPEGAALTAATMRDVLADGQLEVSDGTQSARADVVGAEVIDGELLLTATFAERDANFEWSQRTVIARDGTRYDAESGDLGRKAPGSAWALTVKLAWGVA